jgi:hypothetical protein
MIRPDKIKSALFGGVGFRQSPISEYAIVDADNLASSSGLFFQDASALVTIKNIKDAQQSININDVDFNSYLKQLQESSIIEISRAVTAGESDFIQDVNLFPYEKSFKNTIDTRGKFVGFVFEPTNRIDIIAKLSFIELSFNEDVTFNIYMYNSNKPSDPIQSLPVNALANQAVVIPLEWFISDDVTYKGGSFYVGYFEDDLGTAKALKKDYDLASFQVSTKCFHTRPISLDHTGAFIDVESVINESEEYGLNFIVSIYNDYTEKLIRNKNVLWSAIQLYMGEKVLTVLRNSTRLNGTNNTLGVSEKDVDFDLFGNAKFNIDGIITKKQRQVDSIRKMLFYKPLIKRRTLG